MFTEISTQLTDQQIKSIQAQEMDRDNTWPADPTEPQADPPDTGGGGGMPAPSDPHGGGGGGKD